MDATRPRIAVRPVTALLSRSRLFAALGAAFDVDFVPWEPGARIDAVVSIGSAVDPVDVPELRFADADSGRGRESIYLIDDPHVDQRVRRLLLQSPLAHAPLAPAGHGDAVMALADGGPVWLRSSGVPVHRVGAALADLEEGGVLYGQLSERPLVMIAMFHFVRELLAGSGWRPPPLRASIVFDDPNLRWRSYGYIDYRRLLAHADAHNYHAAMAMIPLDTGWAHRPTVALFRARADRLSLVFHGNDHLKSELMSPGDAQDALAMMAQAMRRVARFERRWELGVDRVMMPPHGLASRHVTRALAGLPFDALCAIHPLPWTEDPPTGPPLVNWWPAQFVEGCAVIPRIPLCSSPADIALRAFIDHPVVLYGHHDDLAGGLEPLAAAAEVVNGLGDVQWMSPGEIALTNASTRIDDRTVSVRPFARRVAVQLPDSARALRVVAPDDALGAASLDAWTMDGQTVPFAAHVPFARGGRVEIRLRSRTTHDPHAVAAPTWRPWPLLRRLGTEARDRAMPLRSRA